MSRFDYRRVLRVGVVAGALLAVGIWIVEEEVVPQVASPPPAERVQPDGVLLRRLSDNAPVVLTLDPSAENELPTPAAGLQPPGPDETPPAGRVSAPVDASGPPPGPGLTGPALPGPVSGGE